MANLFQFVDHISLPEQLGNLLREDPDLRNIRYGKEYPKSSEEVPAIRYRLLHRVPGINHIETRKPRLRLEKRDEQTGEILQVWSQWMTCVYQWDICTASVEEVDDLTDKFDRFCRASVGRLIAMGARDFIFDEQVVDELLPKTKGVEAHSLRWVAYTHQLEARTVSPIDQLRVRVLESRTEAVQMVNRAADTATPDVLEQTYIETVVVVSDPSPSGIARSVDYIETVDYTLTYDPSTNLTSITWIEAGRKPAPGATYYVRYRYWDNWARLTVPAPLPLRF